MADSFKVSIDGLPEAITMLSKVSRVYAADNIRPIIQRGGEPFRATIAAGMPKLTGSASRALSVKVSRRETDIAAFVAFDFSKMSVNSYLGYSKLDPRGRPYRYPYMLEYGAKPHVIRPRKGRVLIFGKGRFAAKVNHPGTTANPFFLRGFRSALPVAKSQIEGELVGLMARVG